MRSWLLLISLALVISACGDTDNSPETAPTPRVSTTTTTTTTAAPATTAPEGTSSPAATTTTTTTTTTIPLRSLDEIALEIYEAGSGFTQPVLMVPHPSDGRWFVVDQPGVIWVVDEGQASALLDINDLVRFQGEQGLLGMAFHPDDASLLYVNYINNSGDSIVASVSVSGAEADRGTLTEILRVDQPAGNHNGGMIEFGPDRNLWIGFGDGGGANDQFGQGQRADTLLGAMLRISVGPGITGYEIPDGNLADEVWAIGLRNPWRFAFDGDDLWIADVGQNRIEEVDVVDWRDGTPNFGWPVLEGTECFGGGSCDPSGFVAPVYEYPHSEGCSITGGYVYRGTATPELNGQYFFTDYCTGWLRSVDRSGEVREWLPAGTLSGAVGFGRDAAGELYVLSTSGNIYGIREAG